jgi:hypothetical protein
MTVTVASFIESIRIDTSNPMTWSHTGSAASPQGVVVMLIHGTSSTDHVTGVTYGGVALQRFQRNVDTVTEPGASEIWFRGQGIPSGTQTVSVDLSSATTDDIHGISYVLDGANDLEVVDKDGIDENATNPSVTLQYGGRTCMSFSALYSGLSLTSSVTAGTNCTKDSTLELAGNFTSATEHQTTAGSSDFAIGMTAAVDDAAYSAIAVSEINLVPPIRMASWM